MAGINASLQLYAVIPMVIILIRNLLSSSTNESIRRSAEIFGEDYGALFIRSDRKSSRIFVCMLISDIVMLLAGALDNYMLLKGNSSTLQSVAAGVSDMAYFLVLGLFLLYVEAYVGKRGASCSWVAKTGMAIACAYGILWFSADFTDLIYVQDGTGVTRGPLYGVGQVGGYVVALLALYMVFRLRRCFDRTGFWAFLLFILLPMAGSGLRLFISGIIVMPLAVSVSVIIISTFVHLEQARTLDRQLQENTRLQFEVMISQIHPHFIYNALTAIRSLCDTDSEAYEAVTYFSGFLRGSLNVLEARECIPMEQEMETVRNYLYIEKLRFGDKLEVTWDIRDTDFTLPACSLQTLVENAVFHGIRAKGSGSGRIRISSDYIDGSHIIEVWDDGNGFDPKNTSGGTGLKNLRRRLELMCGGSLRITGAPEGGTLARITVPGVRSVKGGGMT